MPFSLALFGCSSVKAEKGPFLDDDWAGSTGPTGTTGTGGSTATGSTGTGSAATGAGGSGPGGSGGGSGGTSSGTGGCQTFDYVNYRAPATVLTLKADILPILVSSSCTLNGCHNDRSTQAPRLGPSNGMVDAAGLQTIRNDLLAASLQVPGLKFITPGKPEESYLMNKIDGTANCMGFDCKTADGCGLRMPPLPQPLEADKINKIRDWIKQGAPAM